MKQVAIYVRSSKNLHNVSCEAQERQIREAILKNGDVVYRVFEDKALSSTRDVRPAFDEIDHSGKREASPIRENLLPGHVPIWERRAADPDLFYTGDRGLYRCNSISKTGGRCGNNDIVQGKSRMAKRGLDLTDNDLKKGIEHLSEKLENADPRIRKRAVQALLGEVRIYPKEGKTRDRLLEIIGGYSPWYG
jgi:Resolvase, N terminal domain